MDGRVPAIFERYGIDAGAGAAVINQGLPLEPV